MEPPKSSVRFSATLLHESPISKYIAAFSSDGNDEDIKVNDLEFIDSLRELDNEWITTDGYIEPKYQSLTEKGIRLLCSELLELKRASAEEMRKNVYANYAAFIRTSQELGELETELATIRTLISTHAYLVHDLREGMHFQSASVDRKDSSVCQDSSKHEGDRGSLDFEKHVSSLLDAFDVSLAECKVDEALSDLSEAEALISQAQKQDPEVAMARHFMSAFSERKAGFVARLIEAISLSPIQGFTQSSELRKVTSILNQLGDGVRAQTLLLSSYHMRIQNGVKSLHPSCSWYAGTYIAALAQLYFSTISQASHDSTSIFGDVAAFASELVSWACKETEDYASQLKKHILSFSPAAYGVGAAADCVQISLGYCMLLENQGLSLCPVLLRSLKPYVERVIENHSASMEEYLKAYIAIDQWSIPIDSHGWKSCSTAKLSISACKFNSMIQIFWQDVAPMILSPFCKLAFDSASNIFRLYIELLTEALPGLSKGKDREGLAKVNVAKTESQQLVVLSNAVILAEELACLSGQSRPRLAHLCSEAEKQSQESLRLLLNRSLEMDWSRFVQQAVDNLRDQFCENYVARLLFDDQKMPLLTAEMYSCLECNGHSQHLFPSPSIKFLFLKTKDLEDVANEAFGGTMKIVTWISMRIVEVFLLHLLADEYFWETFQDGLNYHGLQQFVLDIQFIQHMAMAGQYLSKRVQQTISSLIARVENIILKTGVDSRSILQDDQWFQDIAEDAMQKILAEARPCIDVEEPYCISSTSELLPGESDE